MNFKLEKVLLNTKRMKDAHSPFLDDSVEMARQVVLCHHISPQRTSLIKEHLNSHKDRPHVVNLLLHIYSKCTSVSVSRTKMGFFRAHIVRKKIECPDLHLCPTAWAKTFNRSTL